ncbi:MAG: hypothetical protein O7F75_02610 [Alphaproteobacteria bacterium]|nr:hypothetical protein [Alphaproteobacteria bacterium]
MKTAGGFIAQIAGVLGTLAAIAILFVGVIEDGVFKSEGASTVIYLGGGCLFFSFSTIVIGTVAIGASGRMPGILLIISSILGAFLGGTLVAMVALLGTLVAIFFYGWVALLGALVAICMALAFVGGILSIVGVGQERKGSTATNDN